MKKIFSFALLLGAILILSANMADLCAVENQGQYIAYYFHTTQRCATCKKIEALSTDSINKSFRNELKSGALVFQAVNIEEPKNKHFVKDFKLLTKSLVITKVKENKTEQFRNLPKVWELVYSPEDFTSYVKSEISSFMAGK
jgi:hypothetical protein